MISTLITVMEKGFLPDLCVRWGIRNLCTKRLRSLMPKNGQRPEEAEAGYAENLRRSPLAVHTDDANAQHYEVPAEFFRLVLGKHLKYSSAYWPEGTLNLNQAEEAALLETCRRAELADKQNILELGCGWGSLTLFMAARYPKASVTAVSNSASQRAHIEAAARDRGLHNIRVITRNMVHLEEISAAPFDRVVSVEMFEHMKNYEMLFQRIAGWLKQSGKLFVHVFTHRAFSYPFETAGEDDWMGRYFFTGGQMPAHGLLFRFQKHLELENSWRWEGSHYAKTAEAWLTNQDAQKIKVMKVFKSLYGKDAILWYNRWRIFFMACAELFAYQQGKEWGVSHYLFRKV